MITVFGAIGWKTIANEKSNRIDIRIDGAGYDIASALSTLQVPTKFVSTLQEGKISDLLKMDLDEVGLDSQFQVLAEMPFSGSLSWQTGTEERVLSVHPAFEVDYTDEFITAAVENSEWVICETGFKTETLEKIIYACVNKKLIWIIRRLEDLARFSEHTDWTNAGIFIGPHAAKDWNKKVHKIPNQEQGILILTPSGGALMVHHRDSQHAIPINAITDQPEARFSMVVATIVNEMCSWRRNIIQAATDCAPALQAWEDPSPSNGADLERKISSFYKKVETLEHDALTGVLTRGTAEKLLAGNTFQSPLSMILIDVDHFKRVNDTLGHHAGDKVLVAVAHRLRSEIRAHDVAVRWGGEEFVIFLPGTQEERAAMIAERIRQSLHHIKTDIGHITASFGVAERQPNETVDSFVLRSDIRLYAAKNGGRDRVVSSDDSR